MGECVKVLVRCRPMNSREIGLGCKCIVSMDSARGQCAITNPEDSEAAAPKTFTFDGAYSMDSTTEQIYNELMYPLVENVMEGFNGTIFAYGQTGAGKSFSMQGPEGVPAQKGIIPRVFDHIFEATAANAEFKYLVCASYLEIYNEEVRDLLGKDIKQKLDIKEHPEKGVYVAGLSLHTVHDVKECDGMMQRGLRNRVTGATLMNADSSRSHSIFTVYVEMMELRADGEHIRTGKLHLVDLAGSERQAKTGATGERLKEATKINLSLSALGNVISALVDGKAKHIPYRDSRLTRLLQDSLGGNTKTIMVACLSPADNNYDETLSTLRYANRAKNIKNKPKINEDPKDALLREYQEEIKRLKTLLDSGGGGGGGGGGNGPAATVIDQEAVEEEKRKLREEYQAQVEALKQQYQAEQSSKAQLQQEMKKLKEQYDESVAKVQHHAQGEDYNTGRSPSKKGPAAPSSSPTAGVPSKVDPQEALKRLQLLQDKMIGGEQADNVALKEKRNRKRNEAERKRQKLAEALSKIDSDDPMMQVYHNAQEKLEALSKQHEKERRRTRALESEIHDLQSEFELDRIDYLDTIRRQDQQLKLVQQILEKVQPCLRRDSNYSNLEKIKKEAVWDEDLQKWHLPDVAVLKTQLPNAGSTIMPGGRVSNNNTQPFSPRQMNGYGNIFEEEDHDRLKMKLEQSSAENLAANYFKPNRAANIMAKTELDKHRNLENSCSYFPPQRSTWENLLNGVIYMDDIYERESPPSRDPSHSSPNNGVSKYPSSPTSMMSNGSGNGKKPQRLEALTVVPTTGSAPPPQQPPNRAMPSAKKARNHKKLDDVVIFAPQ